MSDVLPPGSRAGGSPSDPSYGGGGGAGKHSRPRRRWGVPVALFIVLAVVVTGVVLIRNGAEGYYVYSPGTAPQIVSDAACRNNSHTEELQLPDGSPCANLIVPADKKHDVSGRLYMVDVLVGPASWGQYVLDKLGLLSHFEAGTQLIPASEVLGNTPASQLQCQDTQQMVSATMSASVAALRRLGYPVKENDLGAQIDTVSPDTPASEAGVQCNDLVTGFDGKRITGADQLVSAIHAAKPGQKAEITVARVGKGGTSQTHTLPVTLTGTPAQAGAPAKPNQAFLGIATESRVTYTLPFHVQIDVGDIGGPSAGLALTLGLLDVLSNGKLTGGHVVAATGTIDPNGNVGDVGGVAQKTVAVRRAGAQLFLVPPQELKAAQSEAGSKLKVKAVSTLGQALSDLAAIGGDVRALPKHPSSS